jgi:amidase
MSNIYKYCLLSLIILFTYGCKKPNPTNNKKANLQIEELTIEQLSKSYSDGDATIEQVTQMYLDRIKSIDQSGPKLNSFLYVNPKAIEQARVLDQEFKAGKSRGAMHGIPVVLKDNIDTYDMPTTAGSRALENSYPLQDSWVAEKLRAAGAVILGKANLSEWANFRGEKSTSGWSGLGGLSKNPYVLDRNTCGSSAGSGVAASANLCVVAIGTETNGSIVCPSHTNGIVGIKPTVGLISRDGIIPISWTQDTGGPMARTVRDAAICLSVLTGIDNRDAKTLESKGKTHADYTSFLKKDGLAGKRIGLFLGAMGYNDGVDSLCRLAVEKMKNLGAEIVEIEEIADPSTGAKSFKIMLYEYKDGLNKYFRSLGEKAKIKDLEELIAFNKNDEVELKYFNQAYLERAQEMGDLDSDDYIVTLKSMLEQSRTKGIDRVMKEYKLDAIVAPTGGPAWKTDLENGDTYGGGSSSSAAWSGYPNITVPMGFIDELPVGISIFGKGYDEGGLLTIAYSYEQATLHRRAPKFLQN